MLTRAFSFLFAPVSRTKRLRGGLRRFLGAVDEPMSLNGWVQIVLLIVAIAVLINILFGFLEPVSP